MGNVRNIIIKLRVNEEELQFFKNKSQRYQNMSSMIRDAVSQFDDTQTKGKIEALAGIKNYMIIRNRTTKFLSTLMGWQIFFCCQLKNSCRIVWRNKSK